MRRSVAAGVDCTCVRLRLRTWIAHTLVCGCRHGNTRLDPKGWHACRRGRSTSLPLHGVGKSSRPCMLASHFPKAETQERVLRNKVICIGALCAHSPLQDTAIPGAAHRHEQPSCRIGCAHPRSAHYLQLCGCQHACALMRARP